MLTPPLQGFPEAEADRYRLLFEANPHPMWVVDAETLRFLAINEAMVRTYGYSRAELEKLTLTDIRPPEDIPLFRKNIASVPSTGVFGTRVRHRRRDDTIIDVEISAQRVMFDGHAAILTLGVDVTERLRAEAALRESEERFRELAEHIREAFFLTDLATMKVLYVSPTWAEIWGRPVEEINERPSIWFESIHPEDQARIAESLDVNRSGKETTEVFRVLRPDGSIRWARSRAFPVRNDLGVVYRLVGIIEDITELRRAEEQAIQAQRLEAVGRLAGGVAHDFNNLLTVIMGEVDLALMGDLPSPLKTSLDEVHKAAERAALLTRQLLAFSRRQLIEPVVLDVNDVVADLSKMLRRLIGEDVELRTRSWKGPARVRADRGQLEQLLANLAVNSRDAMPQGGILSIEVSEVALSPGDIKVTEDVRPGPYILLAVADTGTGMTADVKQRIFEPFFTTKERGKGTGLGLATCFGITKQNGGHISVYSEPGLGTTMKVYLPAVTDPVQQSSVVAPADLPRGSETILLVEDEPAVRGVAARILQALGYTVLEADAAPAATRILERQGSSVHLLLTDVVLPGPSGRELADSVRRTHPAVRVLYASGYTDDMIVQHQLLEQGVALVQKPFDRDTLSRKVREALDSEPR